MTANATQAKESGSEECRSLAITLDVPECTLQRARERRNQDTDSRSEDELPPLRDYVIDELEWEWNAENAPGIDEGGVEEKSS
jgi:hypothetical protein